MYSLKFVNDAKERMRLAKMFDEKQANFYENVIFVVGLSELCLVKVDNGKRG